MEIDPAVPKSFPALTTAQEESIINFRVSHPQVESRSLVKKLHLAGPASTENEQLSKELEIRKFAVSLKRTLKAVEAQERQEKEFKLKSQDIDSQLAALTTQISQSSLLLNQTKEKKQRKEKVDQLIGELGAKKFSKGEIETQITNVQSSLSSSQALLASYTHENSSRLQALQSLLPLLEGVMALEKAQPERVAILPSDRERDRERVAREKDKDSAGGGKARRGRLDPKAPAFAPTSAAGAIATTTPSGSASQSRRTSPSRAPNHPIAASSSSSSVPAPSTSTAKHPLPLVHGLPAKPGLTSSTSVSHDKSSSQQASLMGGRDMRDRDRERDRDRDRLDSRDRGASDRDRRDGRSGRERQPSTLNNVTSSTTSSRLPVNPLIGKSSSNPGTPSGHPSSSSARAPPRRSARSPVPRESGSGQAEEGEVQEDAPAAATRSGRAGSRATTPGLGKRTRADMTDGGGVAGGSSKMEVESEPTGDSKRRRTTPADRRPSPAAVVATRKSTRGAGKAGSVDSAS